MRSLTLTALIFFCGIFNNYAQLVPTFVQDAVSLGDDCYRITDDLPTQRGAVWYDNPIDLTEDFDIVFDLSFSDNDGGADGMALVIKSNANAIIGTPGGGLGYEGINNSLAVEFDIWQNGNRSDPAADHVALTYNGVADHASTYNLAGPVDASASSGNIEDGVYHEVKVTWRVDTQTFKVYFDCSERLSYTGDIVNTVFSGLTNVYFGFTGSTGGSSSLQQLCFKYVSFANTLELQDESICSGDSVSNIDVTYELGASYDWIPTTGVSNPNSPNPVFTPTETTEYTVYILDNCGLLLTPSSFTINVEDFDLSDFNDGLPLESTVCDNNSGSADFDLTIFESDILATVTGATITYFNTLEDAANNVNPIATVSNYTSSGETIFIRVENASTCYEVLELSLGFSDGPALVQPSDLAMCDNDADGLANYDLTLVEGELLNGLTDVTVSYYDESFNVINTPNQYLGVPNGEAILVEVTDNASGCISTISFNLISGEDPVILFDQEYEVCPTGNQSIDVSVVINDLTESEVDITWYMDGIQVDGENEMVLSVQTPGMYVVRVENVLTHCFSEAQVLVSEKCGEFPQVITPNGDTYNDFFELSGLAVTSINIYNRYGTLVYSRNDYTNQWYGQSEGGDELPVGTYFYQVEYDGGKTKTGWVYLTR
ncbi:lectin-like domain-containing protein [Mangrovimonas aestuarii]|uniref:lectin-like domain-containing protein n=1 Tax=Mangrovimonas aestuarii TaxID=3018443 RepID=UPI002379D937|nr:gliding motility-associated C-terminal domain-containing protein [Mangrovimonas aestuarii]